MSKEILICVSCKEPIKAEHKIIHSNERGIIGFHHSFCYFDLKGVKE